MLANKTVTTGKNSNSLEIVLHINNLQNFDPDDGHISYQIINGNKRMSKKNVDLAKSKNVAKSELFLIKLPGSAY